MKHLQDTVKESLLDDDIDDKIDVKMDQWRIWKDIIDSSSGPEFEKKMKEFINSWGPLKEVTRMSEVSPSNIYVGMDYKYPSGMSGMKEYYGINYVFFSKRGKYPSIAIDYNPYWGKPFKMRIHKPFDDTLRGWLMKAQKRGKSVMSHVYMYEVPKSQKWFYELLEKSMDQDERIVGFEDRY